MADCVLRVRQDDEMKH